MSLSLEDASVVNNNLDYDNAVGLHHQSDVLLTQHLRLEATDGQTLAHQQQRVLLVTALL